MNRLELIPRALAASPDMVVMMTSGERAIDNGIEAMRAGRSIAFCTFVIGSLTRQRRIILFIFPGSDLPWNPAV
jgi:hypothetical protein